jgi:hypothetical protein
MRGDVPAAAIARPLLGQISDDQSALLPFAVPLAVELLEEVLHISMSFIGDPPTGLGVHPILQKQQLLVKVVDCR